MYQSLPLETARPIFSLRGSSGLGDVKSLFFLTGFFFFTNEHPLGTQNAARQ
jgi:hypothetical protein